MTQILPAVMLLVMMVVIDDNNDDSDDSGDDGDGDDDDEKISISLGTIKHNQSENIYNKAAKKFVTQTWVQCNLPHLPPPPVAGFLSKLVIKCSQIY